MMNTPIFSYQQRSSSPKVISVPVQFISSVQSQKPSISNDSAARKIQKLFRSFMVRKCVKKINSIRTEVSEIERRINNIEIVNLIRNDPKERLRINEMLMSLLFKLDSVRGIDSGVRDLRKTVTKKAIALQEKVDSIAQSETIKVVENFDSVKVSSDQVTKTVENCNFVDSIAQSETGKEVVGNCASVKISPDQVTETVDNCNFVKVEGSMEKLRDDNEKMMKMMMQIWERNEMQTRMINLLSQRVDQLQKRFMNDNKLRRKKKTQSGLRRRDRDDLYA